MLFVQIIFSTLFPHGPNESVTVALAVLLKITCPFSFLHVKFLLSICFVLMMLTCLLIREGFFFRKDNIGCSQATSNLSDTSSESDIDVNAIEQTGASSSQAVPTVHSEQSGPNNNGTDGLEIPCDQICLQGTPCEKLDWQDSAIHVETRDWESSSSMRVEKGDGTDQTVAMMPTEDPSNDLTQQSLQIEDTEDENMQELIEVHTEQSQWGDITNDESNLSNQDDRVYSNIVGDADLIESIDLEVEQQEEVIIENDRSDWHQSEDDHQLSNTTNEWPQNILGSEDGENSRMQEQEAPEVWQEDGGFQEAVEIWLGGPSDNEVAPVGRIHGFYFPEDDNVYSVELRELLSRYVEMIGVFQPNSFENEVRINISFPLAGEVSQTSFAAVFVKVLTS